MSASHEDGRFEAIVQAHLARVTRLAQRFGLDPAEAEDVAQETFLRVWRGLAEFRGESELATWITRIALRESSRLLNRRKRFDKRFSPVSEQAVSDDTAARLTAQEDRDKLRTVMAGLPRRHREVLALHYFEEMPCADVARLLGCSEGTVHSRLHHARIKLRKALGAE